MCKFVRDTKEFDYSVTLYGVTSLQQSERFRLALVFCEVMESILGSAQAVIEAQYDYNRIIHKYDGSPLPLAGSGDEMLIVQRWESAYETAHCAAFAAIFGTVDGFAEEAHFEIQEENYLVDEPRSERNQARETEGRPDSEAGG